MIFLENTLEPYKNHVKPLNNFFYLLIILKIGSDFQRKPKKSLLIILKKVARATPLTLIIIFFFLQKNFDDIAAMLKGDLIFAFPNFFAAARRQKSTHSSATIKKVREIGRSEEEANSQGCN